MNKNLGRGLEAIFQETFPENAVVENGTLQYIKTSSLQANPWQPRQTFAPEELESLINSIREKGVLQPLVVRPSQDAAYKFEIIAGERRWRAAKALNLEELPVIVRLCDDSEALEIALIENIQRHDLDPIEEAEGLQKLLNEFQYTQEQLAGVLGKSRSHIANTLRLLNLPQQIKQLVREGKITAGHARALLSHPNPEALAKKILQEGLNVRAVEKAIREHKGEILIHDEHQQQEQEIAGHFARLLDLRVAVKISQRGAAVTIYFNTFEEMDDLLATLRAAQSRETK